MATVECYETKAGETRYAVRYRTPDHRTTYKRGFTRKGEAQAWACDVETDKRTGSYIAPSKGRITVAELAGDWLARKAHLAPSHYRTLESAWRVHVAPQWGAVRVADVDQLGVEAWIAAMRRRAGATTVIRAHGVLSGILADAVKGKRLAANPCKAVDNLPARTGKRRVYLCADDVARLAAQSGRHGALVLLLAYCGLRWGEAIALRVTDIEFLRRRITVRDNAVQIGARHHPGPPKGRKTRSVPAPQFVLDALAAQCQGRAPTDLVFGDGGYLPRPKTGTGWFQAAVQRAGVQPVTPHDLRHTCASLAVSAGVNVLALQRMLGHRSAKLTLDTYAELFDDDLDAVSTSLHARYSQQNVLKMRSRGVDEG